MSKEEENQGFRVTDRRLFRETGERREPDEEAKPKEPAKQPPPPAKEPRAAQEPPPSEPRAPQQAAPVEPPPGTSPRIDFPSYLMSYYTQGLMFLGEVPNPMTNTVEQDLEGARHTIEILEMLEAKTRGNLAREEDQLLESILYELRMKFMARTKRIKL